MATGTIKNVLTERGYGFIRQTGCCEGECKFALSFWPAPRLEQVEEMVRGTKDSAQRTRAQRRTTRG